MIDYDVIKKYQVIPQDKNNVIDIDIDLTNTKNFAFMESLTICHYDDAYLVKQPIINTCLLTSLYNAYPKMFKYNYKNLLKAISKYKGHYAIDFLSKKYPITETNDSIEHCINIGKPVVCSTLFAYNNGSHAIAIFGYDKDYIAYYENGLNDAISISAINALNYQLSMLILNNQKDRSYFEQIGCAEFYDYRKAWGTKRQTDEYNKLVNQYFLEKYFKKYGKLTIINRNLVNKTLQGSKRVCYKDHYDFSEELLNAPDMLKCSNYDFSILTEKLQNISRRTK